jgi:hypothetical protein
LRPFGFVVLLAALRWRLPEGRLLLASALVPQSLLPYELVPLALVPAGLLQMAIYVAGSWLVVAVAADPAIGWPATLGAVYLPMLYLVLRRPSGKQVIEIEKDRRRPHRLPDAELEVEVAPSPGGGVTVKVTHLPTRVSVTESGPTRELAERKAHDRLAASLAERRRREA